MLFRWPRIAFDKTISLSVSAHYGSSVRRDCATRIPAIVAHRIRGYESIVLKTAVAAIGGGGRRGEGGRGREKGREGAEKEERW